MSDEALRPHGVVASTLKLQCKPPVSQFEAGGFDVQFCLQKISPLPQLWDEWWQTVVVGQNVAADKPPGICIKSQLLI